MASGEQARIALSEWICLGGNAPRISAFLRICPEPRGFLRGGGTAFLPHFLGRSRICDVWPMETTSPLGRGVRNPYLSNASKAVMCATRGTGCRVRMPARVQWYGGEGGHAAARCGATLPLSPTPDPFPTREVEPWPSATRVGRTSEPSGERVSSSPTYMTGETARAPRAAGMLACVIRRAAAGSRRRRALRPECSRIRGRP
jgi:hypothetical protein